MKALAHSLNRNKLPESSYLPDFTARTVTEIDYLLLKELGIKHLMFDLDQTLRRPYSRKLEDVIIELLNTVRESDHFESLNLVSNNHRRLQRFGKPIGANIYQPFWSGLKIIRKPNPRFFAHVLNDIDTSPEQTVMIGDRLKADVLGGNRMGIYTIYVGKRGTIDYWFDWLLLTRLREKRHFNKALETFRTKRKRKK